MKFVGYDLFGTPCSGEDKIADCVKMLFGTQKFTRTYDYNKGSNIEDLVFGSMDDSFENLVKNLVEETLEQERRVLLVSDSFVFNKDYDNKKVEISFSISYRTARINFIYQVNMEN